MPKICKQQFLAHNQIYFFIGSLKLQQVTRLDRKQLLSNPNTPMAYLETHRFKNSLEQNLLRLSNLFEMMEEGNERGLYYLCFQIFFFFLFVVNFVIHWNKTAMGLHVFPIPIPPPTSLSTRSPQVFPVHIFPFFFLLSLSVMLDFNFKLFFLFLVIFLLDK